MNSHRERTRRADFLQAYLLRHGYELKGEYAELSLDNQTAIYAKGSAQCIAGSTDKVREYYWADGPPITQKRMDNYWGPWFLNWIAEQ